MPTGTRLKTSETIGMLKRAIDLRPVRNTSLIEIRVFSEKADEAARIANAIAEAYKAHRAEQRKQLSMGGIKALKERFAEQEDKVKKAQEKVDELRVKLNISDVMASGEGPSPLMTADTLRKLESLRIESKAEYVRQATLLARLKSLGGNSARKASLKPYRAPRRTRMLSSLLDQLTMAEQRLVALEKEYGPKMRRSSKARPWWRTSITRSRAGSTASYSVWTPGCSR